MVSPTLTCEGGLEAIQGNEEGVNDVQKANAPSNYGDRAIPNRKMSRLERVWV